MNLKDLKDAEEFQKHFVLPLVEAVRQEVRPLVEMDQRQELRIAALEGTQKKALAGFAAAAAVVATVFGVLLDWGKRKLGL